MGRTRSVATLGALALRSGLGDLVFDALAVDDTAPAINDLMREVFDEDVLLALYIGPPRAVQKPVLQVITTHGETLAFVKVGMNAHTNALIAHEAATLETLADAKLTTLEVPEVLYSGRWKSSEVLVQRAVASSGDRVASLGLVEAACNEVARLCGTTSEPLVASRYWTRLTARVSRLPTSSHGRHLQDAMASVAEQCGQQVWSFGSWHGDWAPWNMAPSTNVLKVWDWEHFETGVPLGFDAIHYGLSQAVTLRRHDVLSALRSTIAAAPRLLAPVGVEPALSRESVLLYTLELAAGYLATGEADLAGTPLSRLDAWLQPALRFQMDALCGGETR